MTVGGVVLGPANTQTGWNSNYPVLSKDVIKFYKYDGLDNPGLDSPFTGISSSALTATNVGSGYTNQCFANYGATIEAGGNTQFKTITGEEGGACAVYLARVNSLAAEIDTLRDSLGTDWAADSYVGVLKDTNQVKDLKTGSETMVWSYKNETEESSRLQQVNNSLINSIESQSEFQ